jgi:hypothetical protein
MSNIPNNYHAQLHVANATIIGATAATPPVSEDWEKYLVSPDLLLSFCQIRMDSVNASIKTSMKEQHIKENQQKALNDFEGVIKQFCPNGPTREEDWATVQAAYAKMQNTLGKDDPICQQCGQVMDDLDKALHTANPKNVADATNLKNSAEQTMTQARDAAERNPNDKGLQDAEQMAINDFNTANDALTKATANPDRGGFAKLGDNAWTPQAADRVQGVVDDVKAGTELDMIQLQSLVSQRQTIIQLVTGMMNKINETEATAARAVGGG